MSAYWLASVCAPLLGALVLLSVTENRWYSFLILLCGTKRLLKNRRVALVGIPNRAHLEEGFSGNLSNATRGFASGTVKLTVSQEALRYAVIGNVPQRAVMRQAVNLGKELLWMGILPAGCRTGGLRIHPAASEAAKDFSMSGSPGCIQGDGCPGTGFLGAA